MGHRRSSPAKVTSCKTASDTEEHQLQQGPRLALETVTERSAYYVIQGLLPLARKFFNRGIESYLS